MADPPIHTRETIPLQGSTIFKVDRLGVGAEVRELKLTGMSDRNIAEELNKSHGFTETNALNLSGIWRWCKKNKVDQMNQSNAVNAYQEERDMLESINEALECVQYEISSCRSDIINGKGMVVKIKDLSLTLEKLLSRKQSLISSIKVTQGKIYTFAAVSEILTTIMEMVKDHDTGLYAKIRAKINENEMLQEAFRKIKKD